MLRRAIITREQEPLKIINEPLPKVPVEGAIVKIEYAGICHSDLHFIENENSNYCDEEGRGISGITPGHEISGTIVDIGIKADSQFKVGDKVLVYPWAGCRQCINCLNGRSSLCENNPSGSKDVGQGKIIGGYSTHTILPNTSNYLIKKDSIPNDVAPMLPCSALTAYSAVKSLGESLKGNPDGSILLIGAGGLGQWAITFTKSIYPKSEICVVDVNKIKLDIAKNKGASHTFLWSKDANFDCQVDKIFEKSLKRGFIGSIDFTGTSETAEICLKCSKNGGTITLIGLNGGHLDISLADVISRSITLKGVRTGSLETLREVVELVKENRINDVETSFFSLDEINYALDALRRGEVRGRAIIDLTKERYN
ncbi:unnamed protein product [Dimorphilus gyrociliatus]|uniref:Uncharacterized protein n=1 Tax=Dimorphilus gyrociliatus TaxID=2664684 RepID=A0A7I8VK42_9ANNE|nr:unnamed protein product [Dimorphilus gyrociliatus]